MIELKNLSKRWDGFHIRNVRLDIRDKEYFVILGPTGAGKTLLLELIAGFHNPDSGKVLVDGRDVTYEPPEMRRLGFVYQDYMLFPHKSVQENIAYGLEIRRLPRILIKKRVNEIATKLGLGALLDHYPDTLSGGERQRVALGRALVLQPRVILLDEPLSALDPQFHKKLMTDLKAIHKRFGITTIHVTHNREEAFILADRVAVLNVGKVVQVGTPDEIFRRPESEFVAEFVGTENIFSGIATRYGDATVVDIGEGLKVHTASKFFSAGKVTVTIRPEDIIVLKEPMKSSARNVYRGKVKELLDRGSIVQLGVDVGRLFYVHITRQSFDELGINIGFEVYLMFKATAVNVF